MGGNSAWIGNLTCIGKQRGHVYLVSVLAPICAVTYSVRVHLPLSQPKQTLISSIIYDKRWWKWKTFTIWHIKQLKNLLKLAEQQIGNALKHKIRVLESLLPIYLPPADEPERKIHNIFPFQAFASKKSGLCMWRHQRNPPQLCYSLMAPLHCAVYGRPRRKLTIMRETFGHQTKTVVFRSLERQQPLNCGLKFHDPNQPIRVQHDAEHTGELA